ncbi:MAG: cupin domain-containing protein [Litoreibacter sp.]|nr:cupin domain-containing protein [Litoreibacter sp.]
MTTAQDLIERLSLEPHPEGGWYRQTWIEETASGRRPAGTCIYYLLDEGGMSHWHRVDATEIWHFYVGAPLTLRLSETDEGPARTHVLGPDFSAGQSPQVIVPKDCWQAARAYQGWSLVGCTVSPGFQFSGFTMAPDGFDIT